MRDAKKVTAGMNKRHTLAAAEKLRGSAAADPASLWAPGDKFFPIKYAERLAGEVERRDRPDPDAKTFVPLDQPQRVADEIAEFQVQGLEGGVGCPSSLLGSSPSAGRLSLSVCARNRTPGSRGTPTPPSDESRADAPRAELSSGQLRDSTVL